MNPKPIFARATALAGFAALCLAGGGRAALAQAPNPPVPAVTSPQVAADRRVTFRLLAPQADAVRLTGSDIPGNGGAGAAMTKNADGGWEVTLGPLEPGAYRYTFDVAGVPVIDPRNPATSESVNNVWSLVYVPGSPVSDARADVPHGAVAEVTYYSSALGRFRRMHVYTPPGYENGSARYPVFYLLHGAGDSDDSWTTVGRAGFILDNLIADKKAKPMIVVMPAGHTRPFSFGGPPPSSGGAPRPPADEFERDFLNDVMPTVEKRYRVLADRKNRAIAGLSMGGGQTLNIAVPHQEKFAYVGVFSSGIFGAFPPRRPGGDSSPAPTATARSPWEEQNLAALNNAEWRKGLRLLWFGTGKDDFLLQTTRSSVDLLKRYGFDVVYEETGGGHTWAVWRDYLAKFAPRLFR
jgi:enterochelin esterase family protein